MLHVAVLLANHVHMSLQDDAFVILVAGCGRYAHDDVHRLIGYTLDAVLRSKRLQPLTDSLLVLRGTRNLAYLRKNLKYIVYW